MNRLMDDREARLSETRKKLALWEENLTLAQVDQDRLRKGNQDRMKEINVIKNKWKQSRDTLKIERRQMDQLSTSLTGRESAIAARERQHQCNEATLNTRQQKMERVAMALAEERYKQKQTQLDTKEQELLQQQETMQRRSNKASDRIKALQRDVETKLKQCQQQERQVAQQKSAAMAEVEKKNNQLTQRAQEYAANLQSLQAFQIKLTQKETKVTGIEANIVSKEQSILLSIRQQTKTIKTIEEKESMLHKKRQAFDINQEQLNRQKRHVDEEQVALEAAKNAHVAHMAHEMESLQQRQRLLAEKEQNYTSLVDRVRLDYEKKEQLLKNNEKQAFINIQQGKEALAKMAQERAELNALAATLEERRALLDAFGEDCEYQRETNEKSALEIARQKILFENDMAVQREEIGALHMKINMEGLQLEQERGEAARLRTTTAVAGGGRGVGRSQKISRTTGSQNAAAATGGGGGGGGGGGDGRTSRSGGAVPATGALRRGKRMNDGKKGQRGSGSGSGSGSESGSRRIGARTEEKKKDREKEEPVPQGSATAAVRKRKKKVR